MAYPSAPRNSMVVSGYLPGVLDLRWDDPKTSLENSEFSILGVNVYRSEGSDRGPYRRLNSYPIGSLFYRDFTNLYRVNREIIPWDSGWKYRGDGPNRAQWTLVTRNAILDPKGTGGPSNSPLDVWVEIDGHTARVSTVFGSSNEITLDTVPRLDPRTNRWSAPPLPMPTSVVTASYFSARNKVLQALDKKEFYRLTTVATMGGSLVETPLDQSPPLSNLAIEQLDYIWRSAIQRNAWILEQGGERVKFFTHRVNGTFCACRTKMDPETRQFGGVPSARCMECFGTGVVGGYDGPYEVIIPPEDGDHRISRGPNGSRKELTYEVFMGPSPIVTQRDFFVRQNGDRFSAGPVRRPSNRGNILQQHFSVQYLDSKDVRYHFPVAGVSTSPDIPWPATRLSYQPFRDTYDQRTDAPWPVTPDVATPMSTEDSRVGSEVRGRTATFENQNR